MRSRSGGHVGSERHSPRTSLRNGSGAVERCWYTTIGGSRSMPLSIPFSHRSNHRSISPVPSMFGPGRHVSGEPCDHGPISSRTGACIRSKERSAMFV